MKLPAWMKKGQVVTASRMKEAVAAKLPEAAMAHIWIGNTLNKRNIAAITEAIKASKPKPKSTKKDGEK